MRTVELVSGIYSSALGIGCASMQGAIDPRKARRALNVALGCGVNHLDLARSYGYGEAENFVGRIIKGQRSKLILASKFGIAANWKAAVLKPIKPLVRLLRKDNRENISGKNEIEHPVIATVADRFMDRIPLRGSTMRNSLERSLRALATDYLDYFLIHEPLTTIEHIDELASTAERLKAEGKIRAWGLAYMTSQKHLHKNYLEKFDILQFDNSPGAPDYDTLVAERGSKPNIMFRTILGGTNDLKPEEKLKKLYREFPKSVLLCSMYNEKHILENARCAGM